MKRENLGRAQDVTATQPISLDVLKEKYLKAGETSAEDLFRRVARALASVEKPADQEKYEALFLANLHAGAIGAGRIMSAAGTDIQATLINCFVQPVGDCIQGVDDEGFPGIYEALREAAETMRRGGGVGYDFSRIRPRGAEVKGTHSMASGPCSYINVFDQSCSTVESAGARRGAQMGVLRIDHPDVHDFITAKRTPGRWNNFNVSVGVSDAFIQAVLDDQPWELVHRAKPGATVMEQGAYQRDDGLWVYQCLPARELWDTIMKSTYDFAEPGILFLDHINRDNNLNYCETISATNPCGEQPLPSYGCCDLGPIILTRFVRNPFGFDGVPVFDFEAFAKSVAIQVRALDNVLDVTFWPLAQQDAEAKAKRRKREADGSMAEYAVEDHSWRLYRELGGDVDKLPEYFVSALEMTAQDHIAMMEVVQPYVDTAISKTVNIPADYPYDDFKGLYLQAWRARLKGLATYRPNNILGAVLETHASAPAPAQSEAAAPESAPVDPMRTVIESRPSGALSAVAEKVEYWTQEGQKRLYLIVSFLPVPNAEGTGTVDRAIEFFMPVGQSGESQQWVTSSMRLLSLAARGGFLERALSDMRKVAWDRGPVRLGTYQKSDGTHVPKWHDSEVAAIAYAIQNILARRARQQHSAIEQDSGNATAAQGNQMPVLAGKKCPECGAHAMIRKDGCDLCTQCGHMGSCG